MKVLTRARLNRLAKRLRIVTRPKKKKRSTKKKCTKCKTKKRKKGNGLKLAGGTIFY